MANTDYLESTPAVFSSISLNGSGGTLSALAIVGSNLSTSGKVVVPAGTAIAPTVTFASEQSLGLYRSAASRLALSYGQFTTGNGTAILPGLGFASEVSLGLYRSAASVMALSYGHLQAAISWSGMTASTSATTANQTVQGSLRVSVLSLTTNGAQIAFLSGNTTYLFNSGAF